MGYSSPQAKLGSDTWIFMVLSNTGDTEFSRKSKESNSISGTAPLECGQNSATNISCLGQIKAAWGQDKYINSYVPYSIKKFSSLPVIFIIISKLKSAQC